MSREQSIIEQVVRDTLARITPSTTLLFAPADNLAALGDPLLWLSQSVRRLHHKYGPATSAVLQLSRELVAADPRMRVLLTASNLINQPDIAVALAGLAADRAGIARQFSAMRFLEPE